MVDVMAIALPKHKTSALLAIDVVGYSRLMEADEADTHARLTLLRTEVLDPMVADRGGHIFKNTGDGFLAAFDHAGEAVRCAIAMQNRLIEQATRFPPERRITFRMGLNISDTIVDGGDFFGEGVNVAARLQAYAEPGDIVMSSAMAEQAADILAGVQSFDLGDLHLKNITRPVRAAGIRIGSLRNLTAPAPGRAADTRPSIAVLPFRKLQSKPGDAHFADGIVEEIVRPQAADWHRTERGRDRTGHS
jgi:adenylate cyclase